jgi:hypothetical protein
VPDPVGLKQRACGVEHGGGHSGGGFGGGHVGGSHVAGFGNGFHFTGHGRGFHRGRGTAATAAFSNPASAECAEPDSNAEWFGLLVPGCELDRHFGAY